MSMAGRVLVGMCPSGIVIQRVLVLDWHDGPVEGFMELETPRQAWHFRLVASRRERGVPDGRLYLLSESPIDAVGRVEEVLKDVDAPRGLTWIPTWQYGDSKVQERADAALQELMNKVEPGQVILQSADLVHFDNLWLVEVPVAMVHSSG